MGIKFNQYRMVTEKSTTGEFSSSLEGIRSLPIILIRDLAIDKKAIKVYSPYDTHASLYIPTGIDGPNVMIVGEIEGTVYDIQMANDIFANDLLVISAFDYPSYARVLYTASQWWVKSVKLDTKPGYRHNGYIRREIQLDLSKKGLA